MVLEAYYSCRRLPALSAESMAGVGGTNTLIFYKLANFPLSRFRLQGKRLLENLDFLFFHLCNVS